MLSWAAGRTHKADTALGLGWFQRLGTEGGRRGHTRRKTLREQREKRQTKSLKRRPQTCTPETQRTGLKEPDVTTCKFTMKWRGTAEWSSLLKLRRGGVDWPWWAEGVDVGGWNSWAPASRRTGERADNSSNTPTGRTHFPSYMVSFRWFYSSLYAQLGHISRDVKSLPTTSCQSGFVFFSLNNYKEHKKETHPESTDLCQAVYFPTCCNLHL